ncbi:MAG: intradiol ring-cleavage dioxygenase [Dehalococcoidia bacterium]
MEATPRPRGLGERGGISRRSLLRAGLAMSPVVLVGVWGGRELFSSAGSSAQPAGARASSQMPACVVTPQLTEGPYFVDEMLFRSDIREDPATGAVSEGVPLWLRFRVSQVGSEAACTPLAGAVVDVWQCDALGVYSDVQDPGFSTVGQKFLRGSQYTDESGQAAFLTIYPGWYQGRTVHIHFKVRTDPDSEAGYEFTSQLFFDDALTDLVHTQPPYAAKGQRTLRNDGDNIFRQGGDELLLEIVEEGDGYATTIDIGVDLSAPATPAGPGPGGAPPGGR